MAYLSSLQYQDARYQQPCSTIMSFKAAMSSVNLLRNDRIKFKECFETVLSLGVNKTNASLT